MLTQEMIGEYLWGVGDALEEMCAWLPFVLVDPDFRSYGSVVASISWSNGIYQMLRDAGAISLGDYELMSTRLTQLGQVVDDLVQPPA